MSAAQVPRRDSRNKGTIDTLDCIEQWVAEARQVLLYSFLDVQGREVERLTREEFLERIRLISAVMRSGYGVRPGDRVLLAYPPGLEMICAFFACAHAGVIAVPAAAPTVTAFTAGFHRLEHMARSCTPVAVLSASEVVDLVQRRDQQGVLAHDFPTVSRLRWIATDVMQGREGAERAARSSILFLQYTSGSTRQPLGVVVSHENILANAKLTIDHPHAVGVCWLPQQHDMGLIGYYINAAISGGVLYGFAPAAFIQRPALWLDTISRTRATATSAPNFALEHCLRRAPPSSDALAGVNLSSLKFLMTAAEPVKPETYRRFQQAYEPHGLDPNALIVAYGLAEHTLAVSSYGRRSLSLRRTALAEGRAVPTTRVSEISDAVHLMSCGRSLGDNSILIVDPEQRCIRPDGLVGEIWVTGDSRCAGYWDNPAASSEVFEARLAAPSGTQDDAYLRTGDMGFLHEGELYVCGRLNDTIIVRGRNIYPQDIESVVEVASDAIRQNGVAAFEAGKRGEGRIEVAAELTTPKRMPDARVIVAHVRDTLGVQLHRIVFVPPKSLPKTSSGKIRRFLVKHMLASGEMPTLSKILTGPKLEAKLEPAPTDRPFAALCERYGLTGRETCTLPEAGVDSLDLVVFWHEFSELLRMSEDGHLARQLDARLVQDSAISELFALARRASNDKSIALAQLRLLMQRQTEAGLAADLTAMQVDRQLASSIATAKGAPLTVPTRRIVLTGGTGFFGPFLLASLLEQSGAEIDVLVRAGSEVEARARLAGSLDKAGLRPQAFWRDFQHRVRALPANLTAPRLGLSPTTWDELSAEADAIYHNGADVNYLRTYSRMRTTNVLGTHELLRLASDARPKAFNHISTTFIFGWSAKEILYESDDNGRMEALNFGYSQTKWVAEQLVLKAGELGLPVRVFRPALLTPSLEGGGGAYDITLRLLAFMIKHGTGVETGNQVSLLPADIAANNIVVIAEQSGTKGQVFHVTRDSHCRIADVLAAVTRLTGRRFVNFGIEAFVPEVIRRCTRDDPLFPLLDFFVGSIDYFSAMEFKRYDNTNYRNARDASPAALPDPPLEDTVSGILRFLTVRNPRDPLLPPALSTDPTGHL